MRLDIREETRFFGERAVGSNYCNMEAQPLSIRSIIAIVRFQPRGRPIADMITRLITAALFLLRLVSEGMLGTKAINKPDRMLDACILDEKHLSRLVETQRGIDGREALGLV